LETVQSKPKLTKKNEVRAHLKKPLSNLADKGSNRASVIIHTTQGAEILIVIFHVFGAKKISQLYIEPENFIYVWFGLKMCFCPRKARCFKRDFNQRLQQVNPP